MKAIWKTKAVKSVSLLLAVIVPGIGFFSDIGGVWSLLKDLQLDGESLVAIQGRLSPVFRNPGFNSNHDDASLSIQVRNYSEAPVTLIAASLSVQSGRTVVVAKSGGKGGCTLGPDRNENNPITIAPGATQWLTVGTNIELRGVSSYLTDEKMSDVFVHETAGTPFSIAQLTYVDDLNAFFERSYGRQAKLKVTMQSISNEKHVFYFPIAQGKDLFAKDGSLHHDWFIANWKNWKDVRSLGGYKCKVKWEA
ncbi:hypothetical protein [Pseudomonas sp.]|uniref:hypothetical protein n=1 Tax=Pseudomonas sp. TaxID=306 RepID=UPI003A96FB1F